MKHDIVWKEERGKITRYNQLPDEKIKSGDTVIFRPNGEKGMCDIVLAQNIFEDELTISGYSGIMKLNQCVKLAIIKSN